MLSAMLAHAGAPIAPHDLWSSWNLDPPVVVGLVLAAVLYRHGARSGRGDAQAWRDRCFWLALVVVAVAVLSPLEPLSGALASAHMVQHVLLVLVAAPLLALSAPSSRLLRGAPLAVRRIRGALRRRSPALARLLRVPTHPVVIWSLHVGTLWFWHSAVAYDAAVGSAWLHGLEHATFLITGTWFWRIVVGPRVRSRVHGGLGVLLVFGMAIQGVFLSVLLTFAREPWYDAYARTTSAWGLEPLADQQLAGVLMWVPASAIHLALALSVFVRWFRTDEALRPAPSPAGRIRPRAARSGSPRQLPPGGRARARSRAAPRRPGG